MNSVLTVFVLLVFVFTEQRAGMCPSCCFVYFLAYLVYILGSCFSVVLKLFYLLIKSSPWP